MRLMPWQPGGFFALLSACAFIEPQTHPTLQSAPASGEDTELSRLETVTRLAAADLSCAQVEVILTFNRDYANVSQPSHVVDGCGKRAVYAEACAEYPRCRYLLISLLTLPGAPAPPAAPP
jgi:hypothetical protein